MTDDMQKLDLLEKKKILPPEVVFSLAKMLIILYVNVGISHQWSGRVDEASVYVCVSLSGTHTLIDN